MHYEFIDGKCLMQGVDIEELDARRFVHVLMHIFAEEAIQENAEDRDKARAQVISQLRGRSTVDYDSLEEYGGSNDISGSASGAPLPYIEATEQTDDGFVGLDPPMM